MPAFLIAAARYWKAGLFGLLLLALAVQTVRLSHSRNLLEKERINSNELRAELKAISDAKDRQQAETSKRIGQSEKQRQISDRVAREIEEAPVAPDCRTPETILNADI